MGAHLGGGAPGSGIELCAAPATFAGKPLRAGASWSEWTLFSTLPWGGAQERDGVEPDFGELVEQVPGQHSGVDAPGAGARRQRVVMAGCWSSPGSMAMPSVTSRVRVGFVTGPVWAMPSWTIKRMCAATCRLVT